MPTSIVTFLVKLLSKKVAAQVAYAILENAVRHTDNTVDDQVLGIVAGALGNRLNPVQRVVGK